jgi:DNA-binding transcriptional ArsR family regulator
MVAELATERDRPMLRIHFQPEDLTRTTVASSADVLWEILLGLHLIQECADDIGFDRWRRLTAPRVPASLHPLLELAPPRGYSADFLTPTWGQGDVTEALARVRTTPRDRLARDLTELTRRTSAPFFARSLRAGEPIVERITDDVERFFTIALAPYWAAIARDVEADRRRHLRTLGDDGVGGLLDTLHPAARWRHPVLHVEDHVDQDLHLRGRGLVLVPAFFCRHHPLTLKVIGPRPLLVFPIGRRTVNWAEEDRDGAAQERPAVGLLGPTRTTVLAATTDGRSTTQIARAADISLAAVSHHTKVLREAGLITTCRDGYGVCHRITELGLHLLHSRQVP